ncbi:reverse transcriptase domain-containing protein [Tanacetum coccineum]
MAKEDEEKTAFTTNQGIFCYSKMPFGLKNAGATYQRLVDKAFQRQIGRNLEGKQTSTSILCKSCSTRARDQLYSYGKAGLSLAQRKQMAEKIFPSIYNCRPRTAIKGQILADFIVERPEEESPDELMTEPEELPEPWTLFTDGSSCVDGSGAGLILTNPEGAEFTYAMRFRFEATNNEAEYEALIAGLRIAEQMGVKNLQAHVDSRLVANQVNGSYVAKESGMIQYLNKVKTLARSFREFSIKQVPRSENKKADALSKIASTSFAHISENSMHSGPRSMVAKAIRTGYYWPTMHLDARKLIRECNDCQVHRPVPRNPQQNLTPITSPWPFYKWGIDIAGPFPKGPGKVKFLIVAIDYFTKWIKAKPVATITGNQVKKFVWDNIVCRFGLPGEIVSDNGKQFRDNPFKDRCEKLCIRQCFASVKHPQTNDLVERANKVWGRE